MQKEERGFDGLSQAGILGCAPIEQGLGKLASFVAGGPITEHHWKGDPLSVAGEAMAQRVASRLTVFDDDPRQANQGGPKLPE